MRLSARCFRDEAAARQRIESLVWPDGPVCPGCGSVAQAAKLERSKRAQTHGRNGLYQCRRCRRQFTVTVGTILEDSRVALNKWLLAIHRMCSPEGISARQLQRELWGEDPETKKPLGSYQTASFMCHRVRWAMTQSPLAEMIRKMARESRPKPASKQPELYD